MKENFKIMGSFIKDMSSETPNTLTYLFAKNKVSKYKLTIDINSTAVKNKIIEVNIILKFFDQSEVKRKAYFEITYTTIVKIDEKVSDKKEIEKIILCNVPNKSYPHIEKIFLNLLTDSGYPGIKLEKKIDFTELYKQRAN